MKITEATDEQKIRALAEMDGGDPNDVSDIFRTWNNDRSRLVALHLQKFDYLTSYDAIIPLVQKQWVSNETKYGLDWQIRFYNSIPDSDTILKLNPSQLAVALLIATGKFEL